MCSPCREKLQASSASGARCHVCHAPPAAGFRQCHAMEQVVDSIRVPCPHAAHGCADKPAYHDRDRHAGQCAHAPCRCPGGVGGDDASCAFAASVAALVDQLAAAHGWPCTAETDAGRPFGVALRDGFNFLSAARGGTQHLLLLNVASTAFGRAVSAVWLRPHAAAASSSAAAPPVGRNNARLELELRYSSYNYQRYTGASRHYLSSRFDVECTDAASNELPDPSGSFQFFIPKYVATGSGSDDDEAVFGVTAVIFIRS